MKKTMLKKQSVVFMLSIAAAAMLAGCGQSAQGGRETGGTSAAANTTAGTVQDSSADNTEAAAAEETQPPVTASELEVRFGDEGEAFVLNLEDNETAASIAGYVGTASWRLPIYHFDDYENWEVMQYYDIPSRYEIPSNAETVTSEQAGDVYYSEPNRIILFYQDAEVTGEYTKIGNIESIDGLPEAVESNPALSEGGSYKIVVIDSME